MKLQPLFIFAPGKLAGAERMVVAALKSFVQMEIIPSIIIIKEDRAPAYADEFTKLLPAPIEKIIVSTSSATDFNYITKIKKIVTAKSENIIVHTHGYKALFGTLKLPRSIKKVHTHHGNTSHTLKVRLYEALALKLMKRCDHVYVLSNEMLRSFFQKGFQSQKMTLTPNMLSLENILQLIELRNSKPKNVYRIKLLYLGRLSPEKGILFLIKLFTEDFVKGHFTLQVVGDGSERGAAESLVAQYNLKENIKFLGFQNNPIPYLLETDALIQPSLTEGMPMTVIESLALGIPVLANPVGALPELIQNNMNGLLADVENEESWIQILNEFVKQQNKLREYCESTRVQFIDRYSPENWARITIQSYQNL